MQGVSLSLSEWFYQRIPALFLCQYFFFFIDFIKSCFLINLIDVIFSNCHWAEYECVIQRCMDVSHQGTTETMEQSPNVQITTNDAMKYQEDNASKNKEQGTKIYGLAVQGTKIYRTRNKVWLIYVAREWRIKVPKGRRVKKKPNKQTIKATMGCVARTWRLVAAE